MLSLFKKREKVDLPLLTTDIHSHLLADIDDGAKNWDDTIEMIQLLHSAGYTKFITTPHIMNDAYQNEPASIINKLNELKEILIARKINVSVEAAAEYYFDEAVFKKLEDKKELLTFGKRNLLFETNFLSEPLQLKEFIFLATTQGYTLVLAHPERYEYMTLEKAQDLRNRGVLFQINILSIVGFYSNPVQKMAYKLIDKGWVEFLGSDCHSPLQARIILDAKKNNYFQKALRLSLLNNSL